MKRLLKLTAAPAAAVFALAFFAITTPEASAAEFCRTDVTGHMTSCGFASMEQCQAASAGIGGDCFRDPTLGNSSNAYAHQRNDSHPRKGTRSIGTPVEKQ